MQDAQVTVEMSHATSNFEPFRYTTLTITDAANHHTIVEVRLTSDQFYKMMTSQMSGEGIPAEVIELPTLHHLGKKTNAFSRTFQRDYATPLDEIGEHITEHPALIAWAEAMKTALWAHAYRWSSRNNGVNLTVWRYENDMSDELKADIESILHAEPAPKGFQ